MFRRLGRVALLYLLAAACGPRLTDGGSAELELIELQLHKPKPLGGGLPTLVWTDLEDSRCPRGATCVWAGEVSVTLALRTDGEAEDSSTIRLRLPISEGSDTHRFATGGSLRLLGVEPYPAHDAHPERSAHRARLELSRP